MKFSEFIQLICTRYELEVFIHRFQASLDHSILIGQSSSRGCAPANAPSCKRLTTGVKELFDCQKDIGYFGLVENSTAKMAAASETMQHIGSVSSGLEDSTGHEEDIGMIFDEKAADWITIAQEAREDAKKWKLSERQADVVLNPLMKKSNNE
ncbi:unnamed protein product [Caenorhabditis angaria]|uniref:Uncharacterized protein n=1 Tax=Caenorhabditis angaria TaxID=860376 RepID=A0A9P1IKW5_9PELO|nr:unnamed protein product [Caenorhabditis angaria]